MDCLASPAPTKLDDVDIESTERIEGKASGTVSEAYTVADHFALEECAGLGKAESVGLAKEIAGLEACAESGCAEAGLSDKPDLKVSLAASAESVEARTLGWVAGTPD